MGRGNRCGGESEGRGIKISLKRTGTPALHALYCCVQHAHNNCTVCMEHYLHVGQNKNESIAAFF